MARGCISESRALDKVARDTAVKRAGSPRTQETGDRPESEPRGRGTQQRGNPEGTGSEWESSTRWARHEDVETRSPGPLGAAGEG